MTRNPFDAVKHPGRRFGQASNQTVLSNITSMNNLCPQLFPACVRTACAMLPRRGPRRGPRRKHVGGCLRKAARKMKARGNVRPNIATNDDIVIRVGTECSGMEPLPWVFKAMGLLRRFRLVFSCEKDPACHRLLRQSCKAWRAGSGQRGVRPKLYNDITTRDAKRLPDHDLYVAGFPCQPFSSMGLRQGVGDKHGRGQIFQHVCAAIDAKKPRAFVLENVKGLMTQHRATFQAMLARLRAIGDGAYLVSWRLLNTCEHGVPQNRERVYIVGIRKAHVSEARPFLWPKRAPPASLADFLDNDQPPTIARAKVAQRDFHAAASAGLKRRLDELMASPRLVQAGAEVFNHKRPYVFDIDGSTPHAMCDRSPCITRTRGGSGFYLPSRGRRMNLRELLRLQGLPVHYLECREGISDRQLGMMIGNALSGNVLGRVLSRVLPACGLVRSTDEVRKPWG